MKLELPDDHPIALAIREATGPGWRSTAHLILSLDVLQRDGSIAPILRLEIDQWSRGGAPARFECVLTDPMERQREIEAMMTWPTP